MITVVTNQANIAHFGTNFDRHRSSLDLQIFDHRDRVAILQDVASGVFDYREFISFPPGGPNDTLGRIAAGWLSQQLGQPFQAENRGGNSGNTGTEIVVRAPADGYTVLLCGPANAISGSLFPNLSFNFLRDMTPVAGITREALVMVVHPVQFVA